MLLTQQVTRQTTTLLVAGCWLLVAGCWLLVAGCWLLVAGCNYTYSIFHLQVLSLIQWVIFLNWTVTRFCHPFLLFDPDYDLLGIRPKGIRSMNIEANFDINYADIIKCSKVGIDPDLDIYRAAIIKCSKEGVAPKPPLTCCSCADKSQ